MDVNDVAMDIANNEFDKAHCLESWKEARDGRGEVSVVRNLANLVFHALQRWTTLHDTLLQLYWDGNRYLTICEEEALTLRQ